MPSPYRGSDNTPPAPLDELAWRRRVMLSAGWAAGLLAGEVVLLVAIPFLPLHVALLVLAAWCGLGAGAAVATWRLTVPDPRSTVRWQGWLLRALLPAYLGLLGLILLGAQVGLASYVAGLLGIAPALAQLVTGMLLLFATLAHVFRFARFKQSQRRSVIDWSWLAIFGVAVAFMDVLPLDLWVGLAILGWAAVHFYTLRRALLPTDQEWWFDNETARPGEWVSLLVYRDGVSEVRWIDERPGGFYSREYATAWLQQQGYVPAERALADHLVDSVPPDVLPAARRHRRLRAAATPQEPRLRVASEGMADEVADEASDELDDSVPLDEPEPQRAVAVRDPHGPRA